MLTLKGRSSHVKFKYPNKENALNFFQISFRAFFLSFFLILFCAEKSNKTRKGVAQDLEIMNREEKLKEKKKRTRKEKGKFSRKIRKGCGGDC